MRSLFSSNLLAISMWLLLKACASPVEAVYSKPFGNDVDYAAYKTFNFLDVTLKNDSIEEVNARQIQLLKNAINREMEAMGYALSDDPDLWVNIGIVVEQKVQTRTTDYRDAPIYIGQRRYHWQTEERVVRRYEQGTVTIDLIDAGRYERIWEGVATGTHTDHEKRFEKGVDEAMRLLFARYPLALAKQK